MCKPHNSCAEACQSTIQKGQDKIAAVIRRLITESNLGAMQTIAKMFEQIKSENGTAFS